MAAVLLANGAADALDQVDIWKAVGELGIAVVFAVLGFIGMGWWIRKRGGEAREDTLRMAKRLDALEEFQSTRLIGMTESSTQATAEAALATRENTLQLIRMTDALTMLGAHINARPCAALEGLPDRERAQVMKILRGRYEEKS